MDFLVSIIIAMFFFAFILNYADTQYKITEETIQGLNSKHVAEKLAQEINSQYLAGNGAVKYVTLPITLHGGRAYGIKVFPGMVMLNYSIREERNPSHRTLTRDIYGAQNGLDLNPGIIKISNINGTIYLENA